MPLTSTTTPTTSTIATIETTTAESSVINRNSNNINKETDNPDVIFRDGSVNSTNEQDDNIVNNGDQGDIDVADDEPIAQIRPHIHSKTKNWYSSFCNRWASLFGAILKIFIMILVNWYYAFIAMTAVFLIWFYVGTANPAVKPGLAHEFRFFVWLKNIVFRCFG